MRLMNDILENRLLARWGELLPRAPAQVGALHETDAELIDLGDGRLLALTVDAVVEEISAGLYRDPRTVGRIAAASSLSDLAAVGADALGVLVCATLPRSARRRCGFESARSSIPPAACRTPRSPRDTS